MGVVQRRPRASGVDVLRASDNDRYCDAVRSVLTHTSTTASTWMWHMTVSRLGQAMVLHAQIRRNSQQTLGITGRHAVRCGRCRARKANNGRVTTACCHQREICGHPAVRSGLLSRVARSRQPEIRSRASRSRAC